VACLQDTACAGPHPRQQQQQQQADLLTAQHAVLVLWACARLHRKPPALLLWQLLLLVLADVHTLSTGQLTGVMWSLGRLLQHHGRARVRCYALVMRVVMVAQWRLLVGLVGSSGGSGGSSSDQQQRQRVCRYTAALRFAAAHGRLMHLLLLSPAARQRMQQSCG
jgi:hypothetical protein